MTPTERLAELLTGPQTIIMGILNVTPDSFSDGGAFLKTEDAVHSADEMVREGASIIDVGGESSAPGAAPITEKDEITRIVPAVHEIADKGIIVSVDTRKAAVAWAAIKSGAALINDITAFRGDREMAPTIADSDCFVVLMYSKDAASPTTRQHVEYDDVIDHIKRFFEERISAAEKSGVRRERIIVDPGMGAFVSGEPGPSLAILNRLSEFSSLGLPILIGPSRKGFIGQVLDLPVDDRLEGSVACAVVAAYNGASVVRVHDVMATKRAVEVSDAIVKGWPPGTRSGGTGG
ncbi:MAG: dihydropteroate synthase [Candidatus Latescibacteria bacterium]|jgi:dihydropteroate synthase|nr:dihydropteroate synthase [Candidatus Latescibacterota bacterium]